MLKYVGDFDKLKDYGFKDYYDNEFLEYEKNTYIDCWFGDTKFYIKDIGRARRGQYYYLIITELRTIHLISTKPDGDGRDVLLSNVIYDLIKDGLVIKEEK